MLRFYKPPDFVHAAPDLVHTAQTEDLSHNWQVADCDDCDAAAAALLTSRPTKIHCD